MRAGDPALSVDAVRVHAAMECQGPVGSGRNPVLLVHGTLMTGRESFGWNYLPALAARGYRVCTVDLPNRSLDDIQVAAEYVVVAVHRLARQSGRKVDVVGHSQGALQVRWAVRWWPSMQAEIDDVVSLAGPNQGTTVPVAGLVPVADCAACTQMAPGSAFLAALNADDQTPGQVSYTSLYSTLIDDLIVPNATAARIHGASNIAIQSLCAARVVTHGSIVADAAAFALVVDALAEAGPATPSRVARTTCAQATFVPLPGGIGGLEALLRRVVVPPHRIPATPEPPLKPYALPAPAPPATARTAAASPSPAAPASSPSTAAAAEAAPPAAPAIGASQTPTSAAAPPVQQSPGPLPAQLEKPTSSTTRSSRHPVELALVVIASAGGSVLARRFRSRRRSQRRPSSLPGRGGHSPVHRFGNDVRGS